MQETGHEYACGDMLEPRESDIPVLFLVLVVLPLVVYILLGKWSETATKRNRITLLAQLAAEEAFKAEEKMCVADVIPPQSQVYFSPSKNELHHECARCSAPAKTRCSRCKFVRYCSGNCQIIHWRLIHKQECQPLETHNSSSFPMAISVEEFGHGNAFYENLNNPYFGHNLNQTLRVHEPLDNLVHPPTSTATASATHKSNRETRQRDTGSIYESSIESSDFKATNSEESFMRQKSRNSSGDSVLEEETSNVNSNGFGVYIYEQDGSRNTMHDEDHNYHSQYENAFAPRNNFGCSSVSSVANNDEGVDEFETNIVTKGGNVVNGVNHHSDEVAQHKCSPELTIKGSAKAKKQSHPSSKVKCSKSPKSTSKTSIDFCGPETEKKGKKIPDEPKVAGSRGTIPLQGINGVSSTGLMKMMGLRKSTKHTVLASSEGNGVRCKKAKIKIFQSEVFGVWPRGLVNCGNSCYANAVLQCLTSTKPLVVYLLYGSHSKSCCAKDWCLMCELEQHMMVLRENGAPLSPSRILWHMRSINCHMGDGSQEDAHEFLRLLVASMQSICLEGLGGEKRVDPRLQETTFIQHTFGGRLQSKVKCLNCSHESERYENIMDLTLEILGWVESLEDALTQFTSPEDLDGENMYRCGRCTAYVRARKQLSIHEAPNILTIVLKRFQEGRYGKINKCITFPEMLDMIPFMTGTGDIPPLYVLYAVVVHLDTLNASFSGHYVSYVKDLQGNWFRVDDTEVQPVLVNQVMSEGAYILFYTRSYPRPPVEFTGKAAPQSVSDSSKHHPLEMQKPSKPGHSRHVSQSFVSEPSHNARPEIPTQLIDTSNGFLKRSTNRNVHPVIQTYAENIRHEFSDATSSDWSIFTSSDEASFTTESTRDSFSTVDYGDSSSNMDPISSLFNYTPENNYMKISHCRPLTSRIYYALTAVAVYRNCWIDFVFVP
ncbi:hypothetical protein TSUD_54940 [Trifolium subterraneum]|uniref:ubiquitinyl hydrolase 1 n=1 Tax=Trifolium subterraneum TaxID=3900 RepID=A0A2Z6MEJ3_TRISU|nr:hypothetical protein TSUD_54940 [Trifolium subterraneum]